MADLSTTVTAVVPVKPLHRAKSRMRLDDDERADLALAFALDTVSALRGSTRVGLVIVVTADEVVAAELERAGAVLVHDDAADLRGSVQLGIAAARHLRPHGGIAVVPADLPCLTADDVTAVIASAAADPGAFVPDREGTGTTLVVLPPGAATETRYGPGSAYEHEVLGLRRLHDAPARARHDVDTLDDLRSAVELGTGARTRAVLALRDLDHDLVPSAV